MGIMDGLIALGAAKKYTDNSVAKYKTIFSWTPDVSSGMGSSDGGSVHTNFPDSGSYDFIKGGNIYLGNYPIKTTTDEENILLGQMLSNIFQSTIVVSACKYITDANYVMNIFATDDTHEAKTVLGYFEFVGGNKMMLFADMSSTAMASGTENILLRQKAIVEELPTTPLLNELWSGSVNLFPDENEQLDDVIFDAADWRDYSFFSIRVTMDGNAGVEMIGSWSERNEKPLLIFTYCNYCATFELSSENAGIHYSGGGGFGANTTITKVWGIKT